MKEGQRTKPRCVVRVRIIRKPREREIDGVELDRLVPGIVYDLSPSLASWLIVEHYAEPEMRRSGSTNGHTESNNESGGDDEDRYFRGDAPQLDRAADRRRRRVFR